MIAEYLQDVDLQHCVAVAAVRADPGELMPRKRGKTRQFLGKCVKQR